VRHILVVKEHANVKLNKKHVSVNYHIILKIVTFL